MGKLLKAKDAMDVVSGLGAYRQTQQGLKWIDEIGDRNHESKLERVVRTAVAPKTAGSKRTADSERDSKKSKNWHVFRRNEPQIEEPPEETYAEKLYRPAKWLYNKLTDETEPLNEDYAGVVEWIGENAGSVLPFVGSRAGRYLAGKAHRMFKNITGLGAYHVRSNSLKMGNDVPIINQGRDFHRIQHREYITSVYSGTLDGSYTSFWKQIFEITPTSKLAFPWLSQIAVNYEMYKWHGLAFEFKSNYGDAVSSTNAAQGSVILTTQYNANATPFASRKQMENQEYTVSAKPSVSQIHLVECDPNNNGKGEMYYTNTGVQGGSVTDQRLNRIGNFTIANEGLQAQNVIIGELWATYDILLFRPKEQENLGYQDHFRWLQGSSAPSGGNIFNNFKISTDSNLGCSVGWDGVYAYLYFPADFVGRAQVLLYYNGTGSANTAAFAVAEQKHIENLNTLKNNTEHARYYDGTTTTLTQIYYFTITPTNPSDPAFVKFSPVGTIPSTLVGADLTITAF